jgi:integrase
VAYYTVFRRSNKKSGKPANAWTAQVKVKPYPVETQSFKIPGRGARKKADVEAAEAAAIGWAKQKERELELLALKKFSAAAVALTLAQLIDSYLESPETKQLASWKDTDTRLGWWLENYGQESVVDFYRNHHIRIGRDKLHAKLKTEATTNRYVRALSSAWSWGQTAKLISEELAWPRKGLMLKEPDARDRFLTDDERVRLLAVADENDPVMKAMIVVALATGARQANILALKWAQVDFDGKRITSPKTKNGRAHAVHLPSSAIDALNALKSGRIVNMQHPVFEFDGEAPKQDNVIRRFRNLCTAAGIPIKGENKITFHTLRHSCASYLADAGSSLLEIGSVLGHRSPAATARYARLVAGKAVTGSAALDARLSGKPAKEKATA